jgi:modulator of FtsH protease
MYSNDPRFQSDRPMARVGTMARPNLLGMVMGITAVGFIITAIAAYYGQGVGYGASMIAMLVGFGLLMALNATRDNPSTSLMLFYAFTACEGIGIGPVIQRYTQLAGSGVVINAAATTGVGMAVIGAIVYATSFDFRKLTSFAFAALIGLLIIGVLSMFIKIIHPMTYSWATLAIFSLMLFIDFSRIRSGGEYMAGSGSYMSPVQLAVQIYLDAINIFLSLLRIFGVRTSD